MKKSTIIIIFIVYLASIILIGFFGMKVKAYDIKKYVKTIEMSVEAEDEKMFKFENLGIDDTTKNNLYSLTIYFDKALTGEFEVDGIMENKKYLPLTLIPKVTYDTGDVADAKGESIKYSISNPLITKNGYAELSNYGVLTCYKRDVMFSVYISPASIGRIGSGAIIQVYIK